MSTNIARVFSWSAARKRDEMLEPYEWKRSRTVLRREGASNRPDLVDYKDKMCIRDRYFSHHGELRLLHPRNPYAEDRQQWQPEGQH